MRSVEDMKRQNTELEVAAVAEKKGLQVNFNGLHIFVLLVCPHYRQSSRIQSQGENPS